MPCSIQHGAQLIYQCGPFADQPVPDAMEGLHVELLGTLQLDEAHRRPRRGFGNRFCIPVIVLLRLHVWPNIFRRHQPDLMPMVTHYATKMVSTTAGFHRHHARRHAGGELDHAVSMHPSPHDDVSGAVQTNHAAAGLPQVDPENRDLHWNAPFPPIARLSLRCRVEGRAIP
jgi:hypothetical protein